MSAKDFVVNILGDSSGVDKVFDAFEQHAGKIAAGAAAAFAGAKFGEAISEGMDISAGQAKLTAQLGLTADEAARMSKISGQVYADNFGESMEDVNDTLKSVGQNIGGLGTTSDAELKSMAEKSSTLASTFDVDMNSVTSAVGTMLKTGIAKNSDEAFDILTAGFQKGVDKGGDFLDTMTEYPAQFQALGLSATEATGLMAQSLNAGARNSDLAADAIKEFGLRTQTVSASSTAGFQALGLNATDMTNKIAAGGDTAKNALGLVLDRLRATTDPVAQNTAAVDLFGTKAEDLQSTLLAMDVSSATTQLGNVSGATQKMIDGMGDQPQAKVEGMKRQFDQWTQSLVSTKGPIGDVAAGMMAFGPGAVQVLAAVAPMAAYAASKVTATVATATAVGVTEADTVATTANNAAWYASPVTWIILAIVAAIALLVGAAFLIVQNWGPISAWLADFWAGLWNGVQGFFGMVGDAFMNFTPLGFIIKNFDAITQWFGGWINDIEIGIGEGVDWIGSKVEAIVGFFTDIPNKVGQAWQGLEDLAMGTMRNTANFVIDSWNNTLGQINFDLPFYLGGGHIQFGKLNRIPALAEGGIVSSPTIALIGEAGPEAVVPLSKYRGGSDGQTVPIQLEVKLDGRTISKSVKEYDLKNK